MERILSVCFRRSCWSVVFCSRSLPPLFLFSSRIIDGSDDWVNEGVSFYPHLHDDNLDCSNSPLKRTSFYWFSTNFVAIISAKQLFSSSKFNSCSLTMIIEGYERTVLLSPISCFSTSNCLSIRSFLFWSCCSRFLFLSCLWPLKEFAGEYEREMMSIWKSLLMIRICVFLSTRREMILSRIW